MNKTFLLLYCFLMIFAVNAKNPVALTKNQAKRDAVVLNLVQNILENYHYRQHKLDDSISIKAFGEFLKRLDIGKQFLLRDDVKQLQAYEYKMDDEVSSGNLGLLNKSIEILKTRIKTVQQLKGRIFKEGFDFTKNEVLEADPEKRDYSKNLSDLRELWRKIFKHSILTRYLAYIEEQKELRKAKKKDLKEGKKKKKKKRKEKDKKKKKKKRKKDVEITVDMSLDTIRKKATAAISKRYDEIFERMLKDDYGDYFEKYINSVAAVYDPHTSYFPPKKKEDFDIQFAGSLEGIGAVLQEDGLYIKVVRIIPGGPAWKQKELEVDDLIMMVAQEGEEPVDLIGMKVEDAVGHIRGKKGTTVKLTVRKSDDSIKVIPIIRDVVQIGETFAKSSVLVKDEIKGRKFGYILLPSFYRTFNGKSKQRNCTDDVKRELLRLKSKNVDGIILDLRSNGGGSLSDSVQTSGLFIKDGPIVQVRNQKGGIDIYNDLDSSVVYDGPLIVLINRISASASEILAGALQDFGRAVIVGGEFSHGKGTVQQIIDLNRGPLLSLFGPTLGALRVTIQKFYRVTGHSTQYRGITPDIILPDPLEHAMDGESDLDYSLPWDEVKKLEYIPWQRHKLDLAELGKRSKERVAKSAKLKKLKEYISFVLEKKDKTKVSLNIKKVKEENEKNKKMIEGLKKMEKDTSLRISNFEASMMYAEKVKEADKKQWKKDFEKRKEEWVEQKQEDAVLIESVNILNDLISMNEKKSISKK